MSQIEAALREAAEILLQASDVFQEYPTFENGTRLRSARKAVRAALSQQSPAPSPDSGSDKSLGLSKPARDYCPEKLKPGGCQLHNLHCGYPACNAAPPSAPRPDEVDLAQATNEGKESGLARFGHHPDPVTDFCVEVETIEAEHADLAAGLPPTMDFPERVFRAMTFQVGGDESAIAAKGALRKVLAARRLAASIPQATARQDAKTNPEGQV